MRLHIACQNQFAIQQLTSITGNSACRPIGHSDRTVCSMPGGRGRGFFRQNPNRDYVLLKDDEEAPATLSPKLSPWKLLGLARGEAPALAVATALLLVASLAQVAFPALAGQLIDVAVREQQEGGLDPEAARGQINRILEQVAAVVVISGVAGGVRQWLFQAAAERVMCALRVRLFAALLAQEVGFFDRVRTGELTNRLSEDTRVIKSVATTTISMALRAAAVTAMGLAMM